MFVSFMNNLEMSYFKRGREGPRYRRCQSEGRAWHILCSFELLLDNFILMYSRKTDPGFFKGCADKLYFISRLLDFYMHLV